MLKLVKIVIVIFIYSLLSCNSIKESNNTSPAFVQDLNLLKTLNKIYFVDSQIVENHLNLPQELDGFKVEWFNSSDPLTLSGNGNINRPTLSDGDKSVTIEAYIKDGNRQAKKIFYFTIKAKGNNLETFKIGNNNFSMVYIPAGSFKLGGEDQVLLSNDYYLGEFEVSRGLYYEVMYKQLTVLKPNYPIVEITWESAKQFCHKLNLLTGQNFRLPTETEWEYAANANDEFIYSGSDMLNSVGIYAVNRATEYNDSRYKPNSFGLYHMSGNVSEWTSDLYSDGFEEYENPSNPGISGGSITVKGGSFKSNALSCQIISKDYEVSTNRRDSLGFRLALSN